MSPDRVTDDVAHQRRQSGEALDDAEARRPASAVPAGARVRPVNLDWGRRRSRWKLPRRRTRRSFPEVLGCVIPPQNQGGRPVHVGNAGQEAGFPGAQTGE